MSPTAQPTQRGFNPYTENGGTILAIAGEDFAVIAGDTRQTEGYSIQTRYAPKVFRLTDKAVLAVNGFAADGNMFVKKWYRHAHAKDMPLRAIARLIQTMLYAKRFFPYYVYNILSGIEEDGSGAVYSFDPVGSYEREACRAAGAAQSLVQPFLDNQVGDGLEIYVLLAPGHPAGELAGVAGASEVTTETAAGERVFVIRRELKKD
ncbi:Proteasome subunit beta type-6 [Ceratobasidium sp. 370]|nr:Proteasome subunit beta type-6 [Ceratobasidium sp. 370]